MGMTTRGFESPDETRTFDNGHVQVVKIGETTVGRYTFEPGWRWSENVKPIAKTDSCQVHHVGYVLSGRLHVVAATAARRRSVPVRSTRFNPATTPGSSGTRP